MEHSRNIQRRVRGCKLGQLFGLVVVRVGFGLSRPPIKVNGEFLSGWAGTRYDTPEQMKARQDGAFWFWQYSMHAYPLLEETDGYEFF